MTFQLIDFVARKPILFHVTPRSNLALITRCWELKPAADLLISAGQQTWLKRRRGEPLLIDLDGGQAVIQDQAPLHEANVLLEGGWGFDDLIEDLNSKVYFWHGDTIGPATPAFNYWGRYCSQDIAILKMAFELLLAANPGLVPLFARFNSGAPRWSGGLPSPRGPNTFNPAHLSEVTPGRVVEVAFDTSLRLPDEVEVAERFSGP